MSCCCCCDCCGSAPVAPQRQLPQLFTVPSGLEMTENDLLIAGDRDFYEAITAIVSRSLGDDYSCKWVNTRRDLADAMMKREFQCVDPKTQKPVDSMASAFSMMIIQRDNQDLHADEALQEFRKVEADHAKSSATPVVAYSPRGNEEELLKSGYSDVIKDSSLAFVRFTNEPMFRMRKESDWDGIF